LKTAAKYRLNVSPVESYPVKICVEPSLRRGIDTELDSNCTNMQSNVTNLKLLSIKLPKLKANLLQSITELTNHFAERLDQVGDISGFHEAKENLIGRQSFVTRANIECGCLGNILQNDELRDIPDILQVHPRRVVERHNSKRNNGSRFRASSDMTMKRGLDGKMDFWLGSRGRQPTPTERRRRGGAAISKMCFATPFVRLRANAAMRFPILAHRDI
jgi:hypothetical protein